METIVRTPAQVEVIEEARAYVEGMFQGRLDETNAGQLLGHLMTAELLLMRIAEAFGETEPTDQPQPLTRENTVAKSETKKCQECKQERPDVEAMPDPFTSALEPERDDHEVMSLCPPCALNRFEDS
ncbi:hypothetical protein [Streptomyces rhizosphaericus]|uniref:hypothetical protein n=1 Tax=Streptomyces rhizosphaericus TaxID=114699 RepID=UPI0019D18F70|nr:hypothetical protein [Streptomyces rhizosphaericus]